MSQSLRSTAAVSILVAFTIIGGFLFGYDTGVVSGAMVLIADDLDLSETMQEVVVSATIAGAFIGAGLAGVLADKFGRRWAIAASSLVFVVGALVMALAPVTAVLIVGRLIVGLGVGVASTVVPVYIAEVAPAHLRGRLVILNNVTICIGQLCATLVDGAFSKVPYGWRWMLGLSAIPAALQLLGFTLLLPRSPRWLLKRGREIEALHGLMWLRGLPRRNSWLWMLTRPRIPVVQSKETRLISAQAEAVILNELRVMQANLVLGGAGSSGTPSLQSGYPEYGAGDYVHIPGNGGRVSLSGGSSVVGGDRDTVTELWDPASAPSHPSTVVGGIVSSAYLPLNDGGGNSGVPHRGSGFTAKATRRRGSTTDSVNSKRANSLNGSLVCGPDHDDFDERRCSTSCVFNFLVEGPAGIATPTPRAWSAKEEQLEREAVDGDANAKGGFLSVIASLMRSAGARRALLLGCSLQLLQQLAGINTVMYYFGDMMRTAGFDVSTSIWLACVPAAVQALCNLVAVVFVERCGRRVLTLLSLAGVVVALVLLGASFYAARFTSPIVDANGMLCSGAATVLGTPPRCFDCVTTSGCGFCPSYAPIGGAAACLPTMATGGGSLPAAGYACSANTTLTLSAQSGWDDTICPSSAGPSVQYLPLIATILYIAAFGIGMSPMPWTINSEIAPQKYRSVITSAATMTNWAANFLVSMTFLSLNRAIGPFGSFWLYAALSAIGWCWLLFVLPETKGKTLEQIGKIFK